MLEEFSAARLDVQQPAISSGPSNPGAISGPGRPPAAPKEEEVGEDVLDGDDFAKQLQAGMADLLGELESSVGCHVPLF